MKPASWHFFIPLEAALPVPDGFSPFKSASGLVRDDDGLIIPRQDNVLFVFHQKSLETHPFPKLDTAFTTLNKRSVLHHENFSAFQDLKVNLCFTVAEIVVSQQLRNHSGKPSVEAALDFAVDQLNTVIRAISLVENQPIPLIRKEALPPQIPVAIGVYEPYELMNRTRPRVKPISPIALPSFLPAVEVPPAPSERLEGWIESAFVNAFTPSPFSSFANLRFDAQYFYESIGDYRISCILFASACENLFNQLLLHMLWEEGLRPEEAALQFLQNGKLPKPGKNPVPISVTALVKQRLHPKLSGSPWQESAPIQLVNWKKDVADLRNYVIHEARTPTTDQMHRCIESFNHLLDFIDEELYNIRKQYPITALSFLGEDGLRHSSDWEDYFEQLETNHTDVSNRFQAFQLWTKHVATFRKQPHLLNSPVSTDECRMNIVQTGEYEEVFGVHPSSSVAFRIPTKLLENSQTYERLRKSPGYGMDPRIIVSQDFGGFTVPKGMTWDLYAYDALPGPPFMFTDLKQERGW